MKISVNIIGEEDEQVLAACDEELLGKTFKEGDLKLEVSKDFYGGKIIDADIFGELLKSARIANLCGKTTVEKAIESGLVSRNSVIVIQGVPHAQVVKINFQ